jgi:hypothetical protein
VFRERAVGAGREAPGGGKFRRDPLWDRRIVGRSTRRRRERKSGGQYDGGENELLIQIESPLGST